MSDEPKTEVEQALVHANEKIAMQEEMIKSMMETNKELHRKMASMPAMQAYVREVSLFHRQVLLPLLEAVKDLQLSPEAMKAVTMLKLKTKFYDENALVAEAHKRAADEEARMTVKTTPVP